MQILWKKSISVMHFPYHFVQEFWLQYIYKWKLVLREYERYALCCFGLHSTEKKEESVEENDEHNIIFEKKKWIWNNNDNNNKCMSGEGEGAMKWFVRKWNTLWCD